MGYKRESCVDKKKKLCYHVCRHKTPDGNVMFTVLRGPELEELDPGDKGCWLDLDERKLYFGDIDLESFHDEKVWTDGCSYQSIYYCCLNYYSENEFYVV